MNYQRLKKQELVDLVSELNVSTASHSQELIAAALFGAFFGIFIWSSIF